MPYRTPNLVNESIYHVYNRGVAKLPIFENQKDYQRFLQTSVYYQYQGPKPKFSHQNRLRPINFKGNQKIVDILTYCLMPNHFHFLLRQLKDNGISEFVRNLSNSFTKFYNTKYARIGPLLQGQFKAVLIENDEQLLHTHRYIHLNPVVSSLVKNIENYEWSSYPEYLGKISNDICSKQEILNFFKSNKDYKQFILDQIDYAKQLNSIKHLLIDT